MPIGIQNDLTGRRFGRLKVIAHEGKAANYVSLWKCRCDCGQEVVCRVANLTSGNSTTCGCVHGVDISSPITHAQLLQLVAYDPVTGNFTAKVAWRTHKAGDFVGCIDKGSGYCRVGIAKTWYYGHILAWFYMTGLWPTGYVDHKNTLRADNSWVNLREATGTQNNANHPVRKDSRSRLKGVRFVASNASPWQAAVKQGGRWFSLGYFSTDREAALAYDAYARRSFGAFARTNFEET